LFFSVILKLNICFQFYNNVSLLNFFKAFKILRPKGVALLACALSRPRLELEYFILDKSSSNVHILGILFSEDTMKILCFHHNFISFTNIYTTSYYI